MVSQKSEGAFSRDPRGGTGGEGGNHSVHQSSPYFGRQLKDLSNVAGEGSVLGDVQSAMEYGGGGKQDHGVDPLSQGNVPMSDMELIRMSIPLVCDGKSGDEALERRIAYTFQEIFNLWKQRQKKYGPGNIAAFGEVGCMVRGFDKMARLKHLLFEGLGDDVDDETVEDSWKDLTNYAVMGLACHRDEWPGA